MNIPKPDNQHTHQPTTTNDLHRIFSCFSPQDVEGFYRLYQLWKLQKKRTEIQQQLQELEELLSTKESALMEVTPSAIAQAALSQFRASGIDDIDLLERILARGDHWLDHTWELFERCQQLGMIQNNATEWCEHALEDAYEWLESVSDLNNIHNNLQPEPLHPSHQHLLGAEKPLPTTTEEDFLYKLISDEKCEIHTNSHSNTQISPSPVETSRRDSGRGQTPSLQPCLSPASKPLASLNTARYQKPTTNYQPFSIEESPHHVLIEPHPAQQVAENPVLSTATPTKQSEPSTTSDVVDEQKATKSQKRGLFLQLLMKILKWW